MHEYQTGAVRDTGGKGRMDLIPWCAIIRVSKHMEDAVLPDPQTGVPHYPERNWEKGLPMHSMIDSAFRHLAKYVEGMDDEDHLCAAATNLLMAMWMEEHRPDMQDIPSRTLSVGSSLPSNSEEGLTYPEPVQSQGKYQGERPVAKCTYFDNGKCSKVDGACPVDGDERKCYHV